jgi:O-antigen/teichoic acid export membrane protein
MSVAARLAKGASITFVGMVFSKAIGFLYRIIVGRGLGPEEYGFLMLGLSTLLLAENISNISVDSGIKRYVPENPEKTSKYLFSALRVSVPLGIVFGIGMFIFAPYIVEAFNLSSGMATIIRIMSIGVPFGVASSSLNSVFVAREKLRFNIYVNNIYQQLFKLLTGIVALFFGLGLIGVTWGISLSVISSMLLSVYYLKTRFNLSIPEDTNSKKIISYSWPLFFSGLMGFVIGWTDTIMIGFFTGSGSEVGIYNAAFPLAQTMTIFMGATTTIAFPVMSGLYSKGKKKEVSRLFKTNTRWVLMFSTPAFLLMVLFPEEILHLSFGPRYTDAAKTLQILAAGFFAGTLVGPTGVILRSTDNQRYSMYNSVLATTANVLINIILIPMLGIIGAAYASIASNLIGTLASAIESYYEEGIHALHRGVLPVFVASGVALLVTYTGLKTIQSVTPVWTLVPGAAVFGLSYGLILVALGGIKEEDRDIIESAGKKIEMEEEAEKIADLVIR